MPSGGYHLQTKPISIVKSHENQTTHLYFMWNIVTSKKIHNRSPQKMVPTGSPWNKWPPLEPGTRSRRARFWSRRWGQNLSFAACIRSSASDGLAAPNGWRKMSGWYDRFIGSRGTRNVIGAMQEIRECLVAWSEWRAEFSWNTHGSEEPEFLLGHLDHMFDTCWYKLTQLTLHRTRAKEKVSLYHQNLYPTRFLNMSSYYSSLSILFLILSPELISPWIMSSLYTIPSGKLT